ncbi:MAG TPA: hypothetical protein VMH28_30900 [Candidatus Acidoferrales bacterium]|nr:hypothetical protein [Candidatus Acidoferrales bacterium]
MLPSRYLIASLLLSVALPCSGQTFSQPEVVRRFAPETKRDPELEQAIRKELGAASFSYAYNRVHLTNAAAPEVLVYLPGHEWCGSGGCTLLVFTPAAGNYRLVTSITLVRPPVIVSPHRTNGWNDLILSVSGGGIQPGYHAVLSFDGKSYPDNPTVSPAAPLRDPVKGNAYLVGAEKGESVIVVKP